MIVLAFLLIIIILLVIYLIRNFPNKSEFNENTSTNIIHHKKIHKKASSANDLSNSHETLKNSEIDLLKKEFFDIFIKYENAYSTFDYDTLELICTNKQFIILHKELENLKRNNRKRILENITLNNFKIQNISNTNNIQKISATFDISLIDYTIDEIYNFNVKGNQSLKVQKIINICFVRKFNSSSRQHCPKCGAPLNYVLSNCSQCNTVIFSNANWQIDSFIV